MLLLSTMMALKRKMQRKIKNQLLRVLKFQWRSRLDAKINEKLKMMIKIKPKLRILTAKARKIIIRLRSNLR